MPGTQSNHRAIRTISSRYESYLSHSNPVVLALDPFFVLEYVSPLFGMYIDLHVVCQGTIPRLTVEQLPRAAALIISSLCFIHDLRTGLLDSDFVRGHPLDMDQYMRLFGTARIPTQVRISVDRSAWELIVQG